MQRIHPQINAKIWHQKWTHVVTTGQKCGGPFNTNNVQTDSKHTDTKHTDSKHTDSRHTDSEHTDSKHTDSKNIENNMREAQQTDEKDTPLARHSRKRGGGYKKSYICIHIVIILCLLFGVIRQNHLCMSIVYMYMLH